ncbi:MAG: class I SAM-dependent methyltransferase [Sedimentisphaerales bacterium]|nr:class I SAM-dependent methyltransferase [Sedimentisphaerales bacterium]
MLKDKPQSHQFPPAYRYLLDGYRLFDIDLYKLRSPNFHADMIADRKKLMAELADCIRPASLFVCPLCGGRDKSLFVQYENYPLFQCRTCSAVSPNVDRARLETFDLHRTALMKEDLKRELLSTFEYRKQTFAVERMQYLRELLPGFGTEEDLVLDVGCGPGYFLSYLRDVGVPARGLEISPHCLQVCREMDLDVADTPLADESDERYSLITMFDVIEHVNDPVRWMRQTYPKLRPDGHILVFTPNIHSLSIFLMGGEHNMIAPFNHLCFFDPDSLDYLAVQSGFEMIRLDYFGLDIIDYLAMKEAHDSIRYFQSLRDMTGPVQAVIDAAKLGNSMRILYRKTQLD